jgi:hypothetical protein
MQELNTTRDKNPSVDLDTDDVKETNVQVEEQEQKSTKPNLNVGEVDLGYQTYDKDDKSEKPEISIEEDTVDTQEAKPKENLQEYSEGVQKRIDKLTKKMREAERREQAALAYAEGLKKKYSDVKSKYDEIDESYVKQYDARIDSERDQVKAKLKAAIEMNDSEAIISAQEDLARLTVEKERAKISLADREKRKKVTETSEQELQSQSNDPIQQVENQVNNPSPKARDWAEKNDWFGQDQYMTNTAFQIHENLVGEGFDVDSEDYYNEIDKRIKEVFPHKFSESETQEQPRKPVQTVATANRGKTGRRSVKLTKSQVAIAKKLGVPLEEYAKYVKEV